MEMSKEQEKEFYDLVEKYTNTVQAIEDFITTNKLESNEVWELANQYCDENCT